MAKTAKGHGKKWYWYLGLILMVLGGLSGIFYSMIAIFLIFGPYSPIVIEGELSWRLIGVIVGAYIILWVGGSLIKRSRRKE